MEQTLETFKLAMAGLRFSAPAYDRKPLVEWRRTGL
jgi:hypothetical protein